MLLREQIPSQWSHPTTYIQFNKVSFPWDDYYQLSYPSILISVVMPDAIKRAIRNK